MQWFNQLKTALVAVMLLMVMASSATADSYARDTWDFSDTEEFVVPEYASDIPRWVTVPYRGTYLWDGCELFVEEHARALAGVSAADCVDIIADVSGLRNPDWISAGAMVMVPSPNNTSAEIAERRSNFANLPVWARNPMGMTAKLTEFNRDIDIINQRLDEAEEKLDEHGGLLSGQADQLRGLETQVSELQNELRSLHSGSNLSPEQYARTALEIARDVGVSEAQVESVVAQALTELDLVSPAEMTEAIDTTVTEVQTQVSALDTQVNNLQAELRSQRSETTMSPEAYAETAITIAQALGRSEIDVNQVVSQALSELGLVTQGEVSSVVDEELDERGYGNRVTASQNTTTVGGYDVPTWMLWVALTALGVLTLLLLVLKTFLDKRRSKELSERLEVVETESGKFKKEIGPLKDRLEMVEDTVGFLMELDAQERFSNPDLTDEVVGNLKVDGDPLILRVKCLDGKIRQVHVTTGKDGDGKLQLEFLGLKKGQDFVGTVTLTALQKHLRKAVKQDWVIGVQRARLAA